MDELKLDQPKTRDMVKILNNLNVADALLVTAEKDETVEKSARNIPNIKPFTATSLNVYDIMSYNKLIMTKDAVAKVEEVFAQ